MLGRTLVRCVFLAASVALQHHSFASAMGNIDGSVRDPPPPAPLLNATSEALSSSTPIRTTLSTSATSAAKLMITAGSGVATTLNCTASASCLPTTTIVITLLNPTLTPDTGTSRSEHDGALTDDELDGAGTPFETAGPDPVSKWPHWFTAATFTLIFYDILTLAIFVWLWVFGYLWWFRRGGRRRENRRGWRGGAVSPGQMELARMASMGLERAGGGSHERTGEWVRTGGGNERVRSASQEARNARRVELENELRLLGMF
ncbi:hypothetical protein OPT61_g264 [Boeremia exigua]|uniref:Uncharacterized protein n=1 Tax=Boeremia exigua TaxID=749465 RepID=A0ACC2IUH6_9PLEO|nr:hypothetical protein OPT61_g264 [Boeremia exigua]